MNSPKSRTFKAAILGSSKVLIRLSGIVSAAVLARLLTQVDYAAYRQTILAYRFVEPLLMLGLTQALVYFIPRDRKNSKSILTGNLLLLFSLGVAFGIFLWAGGNVLLAERFHNPVLKKLLLIYSPYAALALPLGSVAACLLACDRVKKLAIYEIASRLVGIILVVAFTLIWRTPTAAIAGVLLGTVIMFLPGMVLMYRAVSPGKWLPELGNLKEQMKYGIPLGFATLLGTVSINIDKLLISSLCTPKQFSIYVNGAVEIPIIGIITGSVVSILIPEFSARFKAGDLSGSVELWQRAVIKCSLIMFPLMVYLFLLAPEIMTVLFSAKYTESYIPFRIYLLLFPVRITNFGSLLMAAGLNHLIMTRTAIGLGINFILSYALVRIIGYNGAAIGTVIMIYTWSVGYNVYTISRAYKHNPYALIPVKRLAPVMVCSIIAGIMIFPARYWFQGYANYVKILITGCFYVGFLVALFVRFHVVSWDDIRSVIALAFENIGKRIKK